VIATASRPLSSPYPSLYADHRQDLPCARDGRVKAAISRQIQIPGHDELHASAHFNTMVAGLRDRERIRDTFNAKWRLMWTQC